MNNFTETYILKNREGNILYEGPTSEKVNEIISNSTGRIFLYRLRTSPRIDGLEFFSSVFNKGEETGNSTHVNIKNRELEILCSFYTEKASQERTNFREFADLET